MFGVLNLDVLSLEMPRWFLVCVVCNSKSFYSSIFYLCIMIVYTLYTCLSFLCKFENIFLSLGLLNLYSFSIQNAYGVSGLCNL